MIGAHWGTNEVWQRRILMGMTAAMALVYIVGLTLTTGRRGSAVKGDARSYFAYLPSIVIDHDLDLRNQFAVLKPEGDSEYPFGVGPRGRAKNAFPIAPALLWLPGYLIGLATDAVVGSKAGNTRPFGYGFGAVLGTAVWSILLVVIGAETSRGLVQRGVGMREALPATIMAWLGTPALYYTVISPLYSHAPAWIAVGLMLWLTWRADEMGDHVGIWIASGLASGWVVAVRLQDAPLLVVPMLSLAMTLRRVDSGREALILPIAWSIGTALGFLATGLTYYWTNGFWVPLEPGSLGSFKLSTLTAVLFSVEYQGWISWTPIVLPGLVGLVLLAMRPGQERVRRFAATGLAGVLGILFLDVVNPFGAGAAFGGRRYVSVTPLIALGLAYLLANGGRRMRTAAWTVLPILTVWNVWLMISYELLIHHGLYPTLLQAARHALGLSIS